MTQFAKLHFAPLLALAAAPAGQAAANRRCLYGGNRHGAGMYRNLRYSPASRKRFS
jgi:hypothetical protein